jgi:hypothetical protein
MNLWEFILMTFNRLASGTFGCAAPMNICTAPSLEK